MLQLWGGIECTVNRVGDRYFDQVILTGHEHRIDDLDRFADVTIVFFILGALPITVRTMFSRGEAAVSA